MFLRLRFNSLSVQQVILCYGLASSSTSLTTAPPASPPTSRLTDAYRDARLVPPIASHRLPSPSHPFLRHGATPTHIETHPRRILAVVEVAPPRMPPVVSPQPTQPRIGSSRRD